MKMELNSSTKETEGDNFVCFGSCDVQEQSDYSVAVGDSAQPTFQRFCVGCVKAQLNDISGEAEPRVRFGSETDIGVKFAGYMQTPELRALLIPIMQQQLELASYKELEIHPDCDKAAAEPVDQKRILCQNTECQEK